MGGAVSSIEWTDTSWNPVRGCTRVSEGCRHCYAEQIAGRFSGPGLHSYGFAEPGCEPDPCDGGPGDCPGHRFVTRDSKGGDPAEWPEDLRLRQWPTTGEQRHGR